MRWVIGDIHGMLVPLRALIEEITHLDADADFFFAGDYVNRGPDSAGVIDYLITLDRARYCRGNHDDTFDLIINGDCYAAHNPGTGESLKPQTAFSWFMQHGLVTTFHSYGVDLKTLEKIERRPSMGKLRGLADAVPPSHKRFIRSLEAVVEFQDVFITHAYWPVNETDRPDLRARLAQSPPRRHDLIWGRYAVESVVGPKAWERTGYFGHTPVVNYAGPLRSHPHLPVVGPRIVLLDTGAALGPQGRLTAVCCDTHAFVQTDVEGRIIILQDE